MKKIMQVEPNLTNNGIIRTCLKENTEFAKRFKIRSSPLREEQRGPLNLFDDNISSYYSSAAKYNFVEIEIKGGLLVKGIMIMGIYNPYPRQFNIIGSNDRNSWETILVKSHLGSNLQASKKLYTINQDRIYNIIKLELSNSSLNDGSSFAGLYEMDYYGELYYFNTSLCTCAYRIGTSNLIIYVFLSLFV